MMEEDDLFFYTFPSFLAIGLEGKHAKEKEDSPDCLLPLNLTRQPTREIICYYAI